MMQDIKLGFRILKYGLGFTSSVIVGILFLVLAFLFDIYIYRTPMGGLYAGITMIFLGQLVHSVVQSAMVQSSPQKKKLATKIPALVMTIVLLVYHSLATVFKCIRVSYHPEDEFQIAYSTVVGSIGILIVMVYFSFAMKEYWISTIMFFVVFYAFFFGANIMGNFSVFEETFDFSFRVSMAVAVPLSYASILAGGGLHYGINLWLYKKDYAPQNFKRALERVK